MGKIFIFIRSKSIFCFGLIFFLYNYLSCVSKQIPIPDIKQIEKKAYTKDEPIHYLFYAPDNYYINPEEEFPLVLYLHGKAEKGEDLNLLRKQGIPKLLDKGKSFPFFILSPQLKTKEENWSVENLYSLLQIIIASYPVDKSRIYITGFHLGGKGVWDLGMSYPEYFAALAPIDGWGKVSEVCKLRNMPIFSFHNELDKSIPFQETLNLQERLELCGGGFQPITVSFSGLEGITKIYDDPEFWKKFISIRKDNNRDTKNRMEGFTTKKPLEILTIGDSLGISFVWSFLPAFNKNYNLNYENKAMVSSALSHNVIVNWNQKLDSLLKQKKYDLVIILIGANDNHGIVEKNKFIEFGTDEWVENYSERIKKIAEIAVQAGAKVYWIGLPPMGPKKFHSEIQFINSQYAKVSIETGLFTYITSHDIIGDVNGNYAKFLSINSRKTLMRADDDIHLSVTSAELLRNRIVKEIYKDFYFIE